MDTNLKGVINYFVGGENIRIQKEVSDNRNCLTSTPRWKTPHLSGNFVQYQNICHNFRNTGGKSPVNTILIIMMIE